jgi:hypothetical protein
MGYGSDRDRMRAGGLARRRRFRAWRVVVVSVALGLLLLAFVGWVERRLDLDDDSKLEKRSKP